MQQLVEMSHTMNHMGLVHALIRHAAKAHTIASSYLSYDSPPNLLQPHVEQALPGTNNSSFCAA